MLELLDLFVPELMNMVSDLSARLFQIDVIAILAGAFIAFIIIRAIMRMVLG
jgi:hypothetical protein